MRDIVTETGTFLSGLTAAPTISSTQTSASIAASTVATFDGLMVYILCGAITGAGSMTVTLQATNDNGSGTPVANNWTNVPNSDLVLWRANTLTDFTPVKVGNQQPIVLLTGATTTFNQRLGYLGTPQTFVANSSPGDGLSHSLDWFRVLSTVGSSWSAAFDVIILLGRPRFMPSIV